MINQAKLSIQIMVLALMVSLLACGQEPPASQPQVVGTKITAQPIPVPQEAASQTETAATAPELPDTDKTAESPVTDLVQASLETAQTYDAKGRFDPFEPLFKDQPEATATVAVTKSTRERRTPQTPLERVALSQLKLSAIIRAPSGNRALVEDATGKGYVVVSGTYIGLNAGKVIQIANDRLVIEEEIENVLGELIIQNTELKLQKPAGEL